MPQLFFTCCFLLPFGTQAQHLHHKQGLPDMAREAHHVLEAKVVEQTCYWSDDHTKIFTKSVLEVYKIFKGDLKTNRLELNRIGGQLDGSSQEVSDVPNLQKGQFGLFFIGKYEQYLYLNEDPITYYQDGINPTAAGAFLTMKNIASEIYQPLQEVCGQVPPKVGSNPFEQQFIEQLRRRGLSAQRPLEMGIEFSFENATLSFSNGVFLEFDIFSKELLPTLSKFAKSNLYFEYNTALFGTNVGTSNLIQIAKGTILNHPNYTLQVVDDAPDRLKVVIDKLTDNDLYLLSTTAEQLAHAKINISQLSQSPDIVFDEGLMQGESFFYNATTQQQSAYPYVFANDAIRQEILAKPVITGFTPKTLRAGTNDTLTITGMNFGNTRGKVWFPDSEAYVGMQPVSDSLYFPLWTNTVIKLVVPSLIPIGSGFFRVEAATSTSDTMQSLESLEILYAVQNYVTGGAGIPFNTRRVHLVDTNKQGGITFRCDNNFSSRPNAKLCFSEALKKWRCATGVNFIMGKDTNIATIGKDGVSHVKFASAAEFGALGLSPRLGAFTMTNNTYFYTCGNLNTFIPAGHSSEIDIMVLDQPTLWYIDTASSGPIPAGQYDFYSVCLHEQGHGHRLRHALNDSKVMYWAINPTQRRRKLHAADILGGINVVDNAVEFRPAPNSRVCQPTPMRRVLPANCDNLTNTFDVNEKNNYFIKNYPNPSTAYHHIDFELPSYQSVEVRIYDLLGKVVLKTNPEKYDAGMHTLELNCSMLPKGLYLIEVTVGKEGYVTKFVKN
jgi:hypothetical protein